ncbi:DNA repair protein RecO, partial [Trichothermofontia sp.]
MSRTYTATGINLKSMPLGEYDRLLTVLTAEYGLIRVVAPGARKHQSKLGGRSALFVVNQLQIVAGRTLHKVIQAETLTSYPKLSQDLCKLTASQYLAELALYQALSQQPQTELFHLLTEHLGRLEQLPKLPRDPATAAVIELRVLAHLTHAIFHLLALAGLAPQVQICCLTQQPLVPDFTSHLWQAGFSVAAGGTVSQAAIAHLTPTQTGSTLTPP